MRTAAEARDELVGERAGLSATERCCLSVLYRAPRPAGALAVASGLTPAVITTLLDGLEACGLVLRSRSADDRRKVMVEIEPATRELAQDYYAPVAAAGGRMLAEYDDAALGVIRRFLAAAVEMQQMQHAAMGETPVGAG